VAEDFGDAHDGYVFGADGLLLAVGGHFRAAEAGEAGGGEAVFQFGDEAGAVVVARGFAGGEEDARVGGRGDDFSLAGGSDWCGAIRAASFEVLSLEEVQGGFC
jgi:hypothetical protein